MQCFINVGFGSSRWTSVSDGAFCTRGARLSHVAARRARRATPTCEAEFNYNIYQDDQDRSRRSVGAGERAVTIQKPLGLVLEEGQDGMVFVASVDDEGNAADGGEVSEGDVVVAVSATFGDEVWSTRGVGLDRVLKSIRIRAGDFVTLVLESPDKLSQRMSQSEKMAANRRVEARDKFGEREVLDPVSWRSVSTGALYEDDVDPKQAAIEANLKEKLKKEIVAPYQQNWILWIGAGIFVLVILAAVLGIN